MSASSQEQSAASHRGPGFGELVALMALLMSLVALSIDAMLPALGEIGADLGPVGDNESQLIVGSLFLGLAFGQVVYGPLSDVIGRKPTIYIGIALFIVGCLLSILAGSFKMMLLGRVLQGLGAAGPRIVTVALVRDQYEGRAMARIMSLVLAVFILVPALAPMVGQGILLVAHWRFIFGFFLLLSLLALLWFWARQPETLPPAKRRVFSWAGLYQAVREVCLHRVTFGYTLAAGLVFGAFVGFLSTAQQLFQVQYGLGAAFPFYFAALALSVGLASIVNSRLVMGLGMRPLSLWALRGMSFFSLILLSMALVMAGAPPLWAMMLNLMAVFFCVGILFGNFNALAMEPLGHIAGVAAAVIGSITTFISLFAGTLIGQAYDGSMLPLATGFAVLALAALATMTWVERTREDAKG